MKKLFAMLAVLLLLCGCAALAETGYEKEDYLGYWKLESVNAMGIELSAEQFGGEGGVVFHEDGTVVIALSAKSFTGLIATYENGGCTLDNKHGPLPVIIDENGKLSLTVTADGMTLSLRCVRGEYAPMLAGTEGFVGSWKMETFLLGGQQFPASAVGDYFVTVYPSGFAIIEGNDTKVLFKLVMHEGKVQGLDGEGTYFPLWMDESGQLNVEISEDGLTLTIQTRRMAGAEEPVAEETVAETPVVEIPVAEEDPGNPFIGQWNAVSVSMMGVEFTVEEAGLTGFALTVGPETAEINIGGETGASPTTYEGDTLMFRDGDLALSCTIVEGRMHMAMAIDGIPLTIILERVAAEAPVVEEPVVEDTAEEPVAEAPANPFIGQWNGVTVSMMGMEFPVAEAGLSGMALRVEQNMAYLTMGGEEGSCATSYEGDTMVFTDGTDSIVCTIVEGKLHMVVSDMTIIMERVAAEEPVVEEPVVEEPVVEEPVVEEPVAEAPANPFIGQWNGVTVSMMGMEFPVAEVGLTGMALRVEQGTAYLTMGGEEGSCATSYEGDTMVFTDGTDSIVCTIVDGKLHMAVSDMTIIMERVAVEEPVVEEPVAEEPVVEEPVAEAPANPFIGQWNGVTVSMMGMEFPVVEAGLSGMALRVEQNMAYLTMGGEEGSCATSYEGDTMVFTDGKDRIVCTIVEGKLHMVVSDMTIIMERVAAEEPVVEEPVVEEPVVEELVVEDTAEEPVAEAPANPFIGQWNGVTVSMMGMEFPVADVGMSGMALRVEQNMAYLTMGGEEGSCATSYEGDTMVFTNGKERIVCTIVEGKLHMAVSDMTIIMERVAVEEPVVEPVVEEPVVEEPVAEAPANPFIGQWNGVTVSMMGMEFPVAEAGLSGMALRVEQNMAYLTMGGEEGSCATSYEGDTMVFTNGTDSIVCTIVEGKLHMVVSDMTIIMERVAVEEPVVEEPVVEEPVVEEPVAEAPANPFIGQWNGVTVSMLGIEFPVAEVGLNGTALRVEAATAHLTMDGGETSCAAAIEGDALVFTRGSDRIVCTIVEGKLHMAIGDMTIIMERVGGAEAPVVEPVVEEVVEEPVVEEPVVEDTTEEPVVEAPENPFAGQWNSTTVSMMGIEFPVAEVGLNGTALRVEAATATLTMNGGETSCPATLEGDTLVFTHGSDRIVCTIVGGKLHMAIGDMTIIMERVGGAAPQTPAVTPATPAQTPVAAVGFDGRWQAKSVTTLGMSFTAQELAMDGYVLVVSGAKAQLMVNGSVTMELTATMNGDTMTLSNGKDTLSATLASDGTLRLNMTEGGLEYTLQMEREGGAVAAGAECDFCGKKYVEGTGHNVDGLVVCPTCYTRFFD